MLAIVLLSRSTGLAQLPNREGVGLEGFRNLPWGISIGQARTACPDLEFARYVLANARKEPWKAYVRRSENREIEGVTFDSIEYRFKQGRFLQVQAVLRSRVGPRTLTTRAENSFDRIVGRMTGRYGKPSGREIGYVSEFLVVVKKATWIVDHTSVTIRYEGTGSTDEDLLTMTMQDRTGD